ncbi:MAG: FAD-dependent oxidoreductase [Verrucomicrobia bacterium]|nr:FAD-dependent oxidoreductase [Verrucomicrobiota bacterium]
MAATQSIVIVGAGVFGLTAALELRARGWGVTVIDPGPVPTPTAASTDISKVVRMDYGADKLWTELGSVSLTGWNVWNLVDWWPDKLFHDDGFLVLSREAMQPGGFEFESFQLLTARDEKLERLDSAAVALRFPGWAAEKYPDGYFNPRGGWAESGKVIAWLAQKARREGVQVFENCAFARLLEDGSRVIGAQAKDGRAFRADLTLLATGAWTPTLLPELSDVMWATGQPVLHFRVANPAEWQAPRFPVWAADIGRTGWYGFPALADGTLKVANHGSGRRVHPDDPREVSRDDEPRFRAFLRDTFPALADAPLISTRLCLYCDTFDGNFWLDHHPQRPGLFVAAGDSGHAFKFAPVLGAIIAEAVERKQVGRMKRFDWRERKTPGGEGARAR